MSGRKIRESNINLEECYKLVRQSGAKGISAKDLARKMSKDRSTIYDYLNTLELRERVQSSHGLWFSKPEQSISDQKPNSQTLEKEIEIRLPLRDKEWQRMAMMEYTAKHFGRKPDSLFNISLEKFKETRIIRIRGKNVDNLEMEKLAELIKQANERGSKINLKRLFRKFKKSQPASEQSSFL
jgi:hypothetical protein